MSEDERTKFRFACNGVEVEIEGDWRFVEKMYRRIMRDIELAETDPSTDAAPTGQLPDDKLVWVVRCTPMMRQIYMADSNSLDRSPLRRTLDMDAIATVYLDDTAFEALVPRLATRDGTLWAELTEAGRRQLNRSDESNPG